MIIKAYGGTITEIEYVMESCAVHIVPIEPIHSPLCCSIIYIQTVLFDVNAYILLVIVSSVYPIN